MKELIIKSILDSDLYKFSMHQAILELFPETVVSYKFNNRGNQQFPILFLYKLEEQIQLMKNLSLQDYEYNWLSKNISFLKPQYLEYLRNYRFNPDQVNVSLDENHQLVLTITGLWRDTVLWEVPLMAIISELYFQEVDKKWNCNNLEKEAYLKAKTLFDNRCIVSEFGTRRRRSFAVQETFIKIFNDFQKNNKEFSFFSGTSNVYLAIRYNLRPIGTMAHEWIMGISALEGLRHANFYALQDWVRVYNADLGIALTDTYGVDSFLKNFNKRLSKLYDGVRQDSGCPFEFTDKIIKHYKTYGIDPMSKIIIFSDGLDVNKAVEINNYCKNKIKCAFGIGTFFTNDFKDSPALNMVIKMDICDGIYVVKLGDSKGKTMGNRDAIRVAEWTFYNKPLDI